MSCNNDPQCQYIHDPIALISTETWAHTQGPFFHGRIIAITHKKPLNTFMKKKIMAILFGRIWVLPIWKILTLFHRIFKYVLEFLQVCTYTELFTCVCINGHFKGKCQITEKGNWQLDVSIKSLGLCISIKCKQGNWCWSEMNWPHFQRCFLCVKVS